MTRREKIRSRIMARVEERDCGYETPCWIWTGPDSGSNGRGSGYPRMSLSGQTCAVHIVLYTNECGFVPGKKQLDHLCRQRLCVRPDHMEIVTNKKNTQRAWDAKKAESSKCEARQFSDQMVCEKCDLTWDTNDSDEPRCKVMA